MKEIIRLCILNSVFFHALCQKEKILLGPLPTGSHEANFHQVGLDLKQAGYNVTIMVIDGSLNIPKYDKDGIHTLQWDGLTLEDINELNFKMNAELSYNAAIELQENMHVASQPDWVEFVKEQKYDLFVKTVFPYFNEVAWILDIPKVITVDEVLADMWSIGYNQKSIIHSTVGSLLNYFIDPEPTDYSVTHGLTFFQRLKHTITGLVLNFSFINDSIKFGKNLASPQYSYAFGKAPIADLILYTNVEAIFEQYPAPPFMKFLYPLSKGKPTTIIPSEIKDFLERYQRKIIFCFGSSYSPDKEFVQQVRHFAQNRQDYGILYCGKQPFENAPDNVKIEKWIPQKELLNSGLIDLFYSHGGINSVYEAIEAAVPLIVTPLILSDQQETCDFIQRQQFGICLIDRSGKQIMQSVSKLEMNNNIKSSLKNASKLVKKASQNKKDLQYWIRYVLDVGTQHLVPNDTLELNILQLADVDVYFTIFSGGFVVACLLLVLLNRLLCGKKA